ncbi:TIGR04282 family arsenosugar biosynthesis glycosyltransferase [Pseudonocardia phyllosphaerae]|uniref:TIGR04282 family arsenosugar biosynthesis glycosyltransferase n=1 Tax=Pseudonocardia phyllosphaerae TaxID=3390502 RepID=UPI00397E016F
MSAAVTTVTTVVLAKAPVPGRVKTRLCPPATAEQAAGIAAAALLDTLDAAAGVPGGTVVAITGVRGEAVHAAELADRLAGAGVVEQRGESLGERIAAAHADAAALHPGRPTLQVGMDTPQASAELLGRCAARLSEPGVDAVLGPATDGGWWVLGLNDPSAAAALTDVPTSRDDTGDRTLAALRAAGLHVETVEPLTDVDTADEAVVVAREVPGSRFAAAVADAFAEGWGPEEVPA